MKSESLLNSEQHLTNTSPILNNNAFLFKNAQDDILITVFLFLLVSAV